MTTSLRIALAQLNPKVGALADNLDKARATLRDAEARGADILLFSELYLTGYFPEDLLFRPQFVADAMAAARALAAGTRGLAVSVLIPTPWQEDGRLFNAVLLAENGRLIGRREKVELPNTDVFYEKRYFTPGPPPEPLLVKGVPVGVPNCEDIWHAPVCKTLAERGAELFLCPNGSPYRDDLPQIRLDLARDRAADTGLPLLYVNQVGGQDELVFDGASFGIEADGSLAFRAPSFSEALVVSDWHKGEAGWTCAEGETLPLPGPEETWWRAATLGLRDYVEKNGFSSVLLGLSGGIDSAVVAALAVDALGPDRVHCVMLPYRYTSEESLRDARDCAARLGVRYDIVPIGAPVEAVTAALAPLFAGRAPDVTEENLQSRLRGTVLMAISNKFGALLLTTGNKSEMAVGYATLYGDMNGGFNPIKDLLKTRVYALARWRNTARPADAKGPDGEIIPPAIITRPPSAELAPGQTDQDSLPPYEVLDPIIAGLVEQEKSLAELVAQGFDPALLKRIEHLIAMSEFKRRQAAPGVKLTGKAFGLGRKYPITSGYRDKSLS